MRRTYLMVLFAAACGGSAKPTPVTTPAPPAGDTTTSSTPAVAETPTPPASDKPAPAKSLYDRLGGLPAITAVVEEFVTRTTSDPRIKFRFFNTDATNLKKLLTEFVCMATGGPCKYSGRDMATTHAGMDLVDDEFTALVENLKGALDKFNVPAKEQGELLGALGPLKPQIVVDQSKLKPIPDAQLDKVVKLGATLKVKEAQDLLAAAVVAGKRGQRSYAEQLFSRAEIAAGTKALASVASAFREGAPPHIDTPLKKAKDTGAQAAAVGSSDEDAPDKKPLQGKLHGMMQVDGKPLSGMGVVMLWPAKGAAKKRAPKARSMEQRNKEFAPHVMAVPVGSTVSFPNFDQLYHNVFSLSKVKSFDLGLYKSGDMREIKVDKPGILRLGCNIHANMSAYLIVVDAPHYVVVKSDGTFAFNSLAPGKYKVQAWSEQSSEPTTSELEIKAGDNEAKLEVKAGAAAGLGADKFGTARQ